MKDQVINGLRLANLVRETVRAKQLFTPYNSILVTLSGGQDSICSLLLLYLLQNQLELEFEVAKRLTGATSRQARTKPALPVAGAVHRAAPSGYAPLRLARPRRRRLRPSVLVPSLDFATLRSKLRTLRALEHSALSQSPGIGRPEAADGAIGNLTLLGKSAPKTSKTTVNSDLWLGAGRRRGSRPCWAPKGASKSYARPTSPDQTLFDFEKSARLLGQFGLLWCNHFWQREAFHTMLHVAKINLCFSSTMYFYLPIESVLCEQKAREWRHKSIQRTCAFYHFECCTQGHTKSDRVETILFNILRGTGIAGLQSLQWKKSFYSFSCQRFYPRLSYYKFNWP